MASRRDRADGDQDAVHELHAPVGVTGASFPAPVSADSRVKTLDDVIMPRPSEENQSPDQPPTPLISSDQTTSRIIEMPEPTPEAARPTDLDGFRAPLRAPERPSKLPKWEKANVTLEPRNLAILERSDQQARAYGFRIRKGGNPSLFVRAGLRLLDELGDRDPEAWIKRIAEMTPTGTESTS